MRGIILTGSWGKNIKEAVDVFTMDGPNTGKETVYYKIGIPSTSDDIHKIYHYAIYPHYLNNVPAVYIIPKPKELFKKLQEIDDPEPVGCPLTGEKAVRHLKRLPGVTDINGVKKWLEIISRQKNIEFEVSTPLDPDQEKAATHFLGPALVVAPAGSGKTSTIIVRITILIKRGIRPENILCITFTRKAQKEMQDRLTFALGKNTASKITVKTFHALAFMCLKEIDQKAPEIITERETLLREIIKTGNTTNERLTDSEQLSSYISFKLNSLTPPGREVDAKDERLAILDNLYSKYLKLLEERQMYDQDYLLFKFYQKLKTDKKTREKFMDYTGKNTPANYPKGRWQFVLIDEMQDNNLAQDVITRFLAAPWDNIYWVGDEDQLLYSFRGSNIERILEIDKIYPNLKEIYLKTNYRSHPNIVEAANKLIKNNTQRREKEIRAHRKNGGTATRCLLFDTMMNEYSWVCEEIKKLLKQGHDPEKIGILYRTNYQGDAMIKLLNDTELPYYIHRTKENLFTTPEMGAVLNHLQLVIDNTDKEALIRSLKFPFRTKNVEYYAEQLKNSLFPLDSLKQLAAEKREYKVAEFSEDMRLLSLTAKRIPTVGHIVAMLRKRFEETDNYYSTDKRDRLSIIQEIAYKFKQPESFIEWVNKVKQKTPDSEDKNAKGKVQLMTVHTAKGLEFDTVFVVNCSEGYFPHDTSSDLEEERRIFYVAMTRAREMLYLTGYTNNLTPSRFLYESGMVEIAEELEDNEPTEALTEITV